MNKLMSGFLLTIATHLIIGCAGSPAQIAMMSKSNMASVSNQDLCNAVAFIGDRDAESVLIDRGALTSEEWELIYQKRIRLGMSELALICSWGYPDKTHRTVGSFGEHKQFVYRACRDCRAQYVYTKNGKITSFQD